MKYSFSLSSVRALLALVCGCGAWTASGLEVELRLAEPLGVAREPALVVSGVPLARGALRDVGRLALTLDGQPLAAQFRPLAAWDDGSVRWALVTTQAPVAAGGAALLKLSDGGGNPAPKQPVKIAESATAVTLTTGPLTVELAKKSGALIESVRLDGRLVAQAGGRGVVLLDEEGQERRAGAPTTVTIEEAGPLRAVVCLRGRFPGLHNNLLGYTARVSVWAGEPLVKVHYWLENDGASGHAKDEKRPIEWFAFDGLALDLGLDLGGPVTARCEGVEAVDRLKVLQLGHDQEAGAKLENRRHFAYSNFQYRVTSGENLLKQGLRSDGVVELKGAAGQLTAAIRDFWQNYEKAVELDRGRLRLWLWPPEGEWPRPGRNIPHGQLRRYNNLARSGRYLLQGATHKGHELVIDFAVRPAAATQAELTVPLLARAAPEYYAATGALPGIFGPRQSKSGNRECDLKLASWARMSRAMADPASPFGIPAASHFTESFAVGYYQDASHWFGWMDYGDLSVPGTGQVSLHYDWPLLMLYEYLAGGDHHSLKLATAMARHHIDIDQFWSDRDGQPEYKLHRRGNAFPTWHFNSQFGSSTMTDNWLAGTALWHLLTGEPKAREACLRNAEGIVAVWEKIAATRPYNGPQHNMAANGWAIESLCAAYDITGDRRWLDEALKLFDGNVTKRWETYGPHLHAPILLASQEYSQFDKAYCYAIASLCILHARTGEERVLRLLVEGCEKPFPESYFDAPMFLAGLFAYTGAVTGKAAYLERALDLFAQGFPESASPPVVMPGDSTWSVTSAMRLRAGYPLQYALWRRQPQRGKTQP